jgi:hypothetical protein
MSLRIASNPSLVYIYAPAMTKKPWICPALLDESVDGIYIERHHTQQSRHIVPYILDTGQSICIISNRLVRALFFYELSILLELGNSYMLYRYISPKWKLQHLILMSIRSYRLLRESFFTHSICPWLLFWRGASEAHRRADDMPITHTAQLKFGYIFLDGHGGFF